ncbi:MAG: Phosphate ABC transporter substrate-binding protein, PhoT family [Methanomicrobiales archaeon 53_19]|jgi:phosphate transport system substrate-binding protein|uniref:phosphate ABC transporter substrate-binding protein n=1 Tax=Methanocalculus sp. TaxID=2004547 RepID=UPI000746A7B1|nr:phosphate ABC transporter substrate-binding protein [Methanocalculus sp.]KUK68483.1 MAG: Phosphate ABC transporter substrate-binding protein, PhoT family [Methanocalculus sp. 52_23]KUL04276.1 MAG: Phosphate ABC transporter substrate-binding protein, PhoT family [Methanomicrobiales archaeon 53_19]HIJ06033.1 phosphate ABC transporter substrate-binding protein [Methanocalculus sp.]
MTRSFSIRSSPAFLAGAVVLLLAAALVSGCVGSDPSVEQRSISVTGSTTVLPIAQIAADTYMDKHPNDEILVSGGGSSVGVKAVGEGTADIGMASRDLKSSEMEQYPGLVEHVVAVDGIALIVNPENSISSLTLDQIKAIYKGEITNWKDVGGSDRQIVVVGRDSASGTREFFYEAVMQKEEFVRTQQELNSNGAVKQTVAQTPDAIGYVGLGYIDTSVKAVNINMDGVLVEPTIDNVENKAYPIARSLHMYTKGPETGLAKDFLEFLMSAEGQQIVSNEGFVPII